jgi:hypothetical protein
MDFWTLVVGFKLVFLADAHYILTTSKKVKM